MRKTPPPLLEKVLTHSVHIIITNKMGMNHTFILNQIKMTDNDQNFPSLVSILESEKQIKETEFIYHIILLADPLWRK